MIDETKRTLLCCCLKVQHRFSNRQRVSEEMACRVVLCRPVELVVDFYTAISEEPCAPVTKAIHARLGDKALRTHDVCMRAEIVQPVAHAALGAANNAVHEFRGEKPVTCDGSQDRTIALGDAECRQL